MKTVHHTNDTQNFMHVGGVTIPPGETRAVDAALLPDYEPEDDAGNGQAVPDDPLVLLLAASVATITAALPDLSDADLVRAGELEAAGVNRKSLMSALSVEQLRRVALANGG